MVQFSQESSRRVIHSLGLCAILLLSFLSLFPNTGKAGHVWSIETVDPEDETGSSSSIAMDSHDTPHTSYRGVGNLRYAYWKGPSWVIQTVDSNLSVGLYTSISLDSQDHPHISYYDKANGDLKYAHWNGSAWDIQVVDSEGNVGGHTSIDIDSKGNPHIAYGNGTNLDLKYAHWNGTEWEIETVDSAGDFGMYINLALDSNDRAHISYYQSGGGVADLRYAHWTGSNWIKYSIDHENSTGVENSLALDSMDSPHIAYYDYTNGYLKYASWTGTDWEIEIIRVEAKSLGQYVSLTIDSEDRPHMARVPPGNSPFLYITKENASWVEEVVEVSGGQSRPSIALDSLNRPHVSYGYESGGPYNLMYARTIPPPEPDLVLFSSDISFAPSSPIINGTLVTINSTVHNVGGSTAWNVYVRFHDGHPPSGATIGTDKYVSSIPREGHANVSTVWTATTSGTHQICVHADPDDSITEFDEANNIACKSIEVLPSSAPGPPRNLNARLSGPNLEDVTLTWDLSVDDGSGGSVTGYEIHRSGVYDSSRMGYQLLQSLLNGTSAYVDASSGEGDPDNHFYCVCAITSANLSSCTLNQAGKFTRQLSRGPNLVSVPLIQSNESIERVLQTVKYDKAWSYDSSSGKWKSYMIFKPYKGDLATINETQGFWVNATEDCNFTIAGIVPHNTTIHLMKGWNLVSFPSFKENYTVADVKLEVNAVRVEGFRSSSEPYYLVALQDTEKLMAGFAYWVKIPQEASWLVSS